jgi:hypothetical protein
MTAKLSGPRIVSIDPGVKLAGITLWQAGIMVNATLLRGEHWTDVADSAAEFFSGIGLDQIVIEKPQVYVRSRSKGDPNDLIDLALAAGAITQALRMGSPFASIHEYKPAEWKGQLPKDICVERTRFALTDDERKRVNLPRAKSLAHNVWDSVGIGLKHLKRSRLRAV